VVWTLEHYAAPFVSTGKLVRVLKDWCPPFPGYFLYYPSRRQQPAALPALIKTLQLQESLGSVSVGADHDQVEAAAGHGVLRAARASAPSTPALAPSAGGTM
jgi:hypothetical protein